MSMLRSVKVYPTFNDAAHDRPILTDSGSWRAVVILLALLLVVNGLALLLMLR